MKRKKTKMILCTAAIVSMAFIMSFPAFAADKKIKSVSVRVSGDFKVGMVPGDETIEVDSSSKGYQVTDYELISESVEWEPWSPDSDAQLEIVLQAEDDYVFALSKASEVKLSGNLKPTYVSGKKRNKSTELVLTVKLECLQRGAGEVESAGWDGATSCVAKFESLAVIGHEIQLYRDNDEVGAPQKVTTGQNSMDLSYLMKKPGKYTFKVREWNEESGKRGVWFECEDVFELSEEIAAKNKEQYAYYTTDNYGWQNDGVGWWFSTPGGYPKSEWMTDNNQKFYFNDKGYMVTGWNEINGKWYFFNDKGELLINTTTPDGYVVNEDGVWVA